MKRLLATLILLTFAACLFGQNQIQVKKFVYKGEEVTNFADTIYYQNDSIIIAWAIGDNDTIPLGSDILPSQVVVYSSGTITKYTDFSTAVAAATANDLIILLSGTYTETGTVTMPDQSALVIQNGAQLSGTFTLVGDSTRLDAGLYQIFGANVTLSGTWVVDKTYVDWFGATGSGDEVTEIQAAMDFTNLTTGKTLVFQQRTYEIGTASTLNFRGGTIQGNHATLDVTHSTSDVALQCAPSSAIGTYEAAIYDINPGQTQIKFNTGSTLLSGLAVGDFIKIKSDSIITTDYPTVYAGEIAQIININDTTITLASPINDRYTLSDNDSIAEVQMIQCNVYDLNIQHNNADESFGLYMAWCKNSEVSNCNIYDAKWAGISLLECYDPVINNCNVTRSDLTGAGYGVWLVGATMNAKISDCNFHTNRHAIATSGYDTYNGGIAHNTLIDNCMGHANKIHVFDAHEPCGAITYSNCVAIGGLADADTSNYLGTWASGTAYTTGQVVTYGTMMYEAAQSTTGDTPSDEASTYWTIYDNDIDGFTVYCDDVSILNCKTINCGKGFSSSANGQNGFTIDGLTAINSKFTIDINDSISNSYINNIHAYNSDRDVYKQGAYLLALDSAAIFNSFFGNLKGSQNGIQLTRNRYPMDLIIDQINCKGKLISYSLLGDTVSFHFNNAVISGTSGNSSMINNGTATLCKTISINKLVIDSLYDDFFYANAAFKNLYFGDVIVNNTSSGDKLIVNTSSFEDVKINSVVNTSAKDLDIILASSIGKFYLGNTSGVIGYNYSVNPTLEMLAGGEKYPIILRGAGSPEGVVAAKIGSIYLRNDASSLGGNAVYFKDGDNNGTSSWRSITGYLGNFSFNGSYFKHSTDTAFYSPSNTEVLRLGYLAARAGDGSTVVGHKSGQSLATGGTNNTFMGRFSGNKTTTGDYNTFIGYSAGQLNVTGSGNVCVGYQAGQTNTSSDKLYIENSNSATPLIYGDFANDYVNIVSKLLIGTSLASPTAGLVVNAGGAQINEFLYIQPQSSPPGSPSLGYIYVDSDDNHIYFYNGSTWVQMDN